MGRQGPHRVRGRHHRVRADGERSRCVLAQLQVQAAARRALGNVPRPRLHGAGRRRAERSGRASTARRRDGRQSGERVAVAEVRRARRQSVGGPVLVGRLLLQDVHEAAALVAGLSEDPRPFRCRRRHRRRCRARVLRQALHPRRRLRGRWRAGGHGGGSRSRPIRRERAARRRGIRPRRPPPLRRRSRVGGVGRTARRGRCAKVDRGDDERCGHRPVRHELDRRRAAPARNLRTWPLHPRTAVQGARRRVGRCGGTDRAPIRIRRQRSSWRDVVDSSAAARQSARGASR